MHPRFSAIRSLLTPALCALALWAVAPSVLAVTTIFSSSGSAADIQPTVEAFRASLGSLNANQPVNFGGGRREINWDAVPDAFASPNLLPGNFFNQAAVGRARGVEFTQAPGGFMVSADASNPSATAAGFGASANLTPFSAERLFASVGSTAYDVEFFNPASLGQRATTRGFGVVFADVDAASSGLEFFDAQGQSLLSLVPQADQQTGAGFSFVGALFDTAQVSYVRIIAGEVALQASGLFASTPGDIVAVDDFIYGETQPVPEPQSLALMLAGLAGVARVVVVRRRRQAVTPWRDA